MSDLTLDKMILAEAAKGNCVVGIQGSTTMWAPGTEPLLARMWSEKGRKAKLLRRDETTEPIKASALARSLPRKAWKNGRWREGTNGDLVSRFRALRVHPSHRDYWRAEPRPREWLLIEWTEDKDEPLKYWLSMMPAETTITTLVDTAKLRWRIERDFRDLKQAIGIDHEEGRRWRGFHHPPLHTLSAPSRAKPRPTTKGTAHER